MRQAAGTSAVGHKVGVPGGGRAVSDKLESGGAADPNRKRHGMGEEPPAAGTPSRTAPAAKALRCAVAGHPGKQSVYAQSLGGNGPRDSSPGLKME